MTEDNVSLRLARAEDAPELLKIYSPYVTQTVVTFEYTVPTEEEFAHRIIHTLGEYPYLVAEASGCVAGYAYAARFRERAAYDWAAECSVYVREEFQRHGIGRLLYEELERLLRLQNVTTMNACIAYPNKCSIKFHSSLDFERVGRITKCAYKMGQWIDIIWMQKQLTEDNGSPRPFIPLPQLPASCLPKENG